jgi:hypothetical protein
LGLPIFSLHLSKASLDIVNLPSQFTRDFHHEQRNQSN